ncbi:hypothetical protein [Adlercreutzia shanghongiae]|uniref:Uncharacterized protein n=1 Tax=Adlercreutzia shanghongiae TaxID=3111773 RepID=A0ABU6IVX2_9ACTN|nr:hypothetical protein [Adlercreutzia sp. R22]MEC4293836.1 hypothetical protein [Adlercreutzia sp. R22]
MSDQIIAKPIEILRLASEIVAGCEQLYQSSAAVKRSCDVLGSSFRDEAFRKVEDAVEIATTGYELVKEDIYDSVTALETYANRLIEGA